MFKSCTIFIIPWFGLMLFAGCSDNVANDEPAQQDAGADSGIVDSDGAGDAGDSLLGDEANFQDQGDTGVDDGAVNPCLAAASAQLLISEVGIQPAQAEFIEIWNSGSTTVDLADFFLSDNAEYYLITSGTDWVPQTSAPGSDFLARFPPGTLLAPNSYLVVQAASGDFDTQFATCPDFAIGDDPITCKGSPVPKMIAPTDGDLGTSEGIMLSNSSEMVILFCWDGQSSTVKDVDYVTWGTGFDNTGRMDKTGISGYQPDTPRASQTPAPAVNSSTDEIAIARCAAIETGETSALGNGCVGHNESSEQLSSTFKAKTTATPGAATSCK